MKRIEKIIICHSDQGGRFMTGFDSRPSERDMKQKPFEAKDVPGFGTVIQGLFNALAYNIQIEDVAKRQPEVRLILEIEDRRKQKTGFRSRACCAIAQISGHPATSSYFAVDFMQEILWLDDVLSLRASPVSIKAVQLKNLFTNRHNWSVFNIVRIFHHFHPAKVRQATLEDYRRADEEAKAWFDTSYLSLCNDFE
ncbi:hypothetical protein ABFV80_002638 [Vandammella animalimorsus]|uniref:hypothetical protein n=1 Tax=Vandammella animalimorsus TaxID=2029117 RepID=UPI00325B7751